MSKPDPELNFNEDNKLEAMIYKIVGVDEWAAAQSAGKYTGSADDVRDGFIHFSSSEQVAGTAAKHFADRDDLLILGIETSVLGDDLKWEASRGGALFPHLYGSFETNKVAFVEKLTLNEHGEHVIPAKVSG